MSRRHAMLLLLIAGCGGPSAGGALDDGLLPVETSFVVKAPAAPMPAARPVLTPCPAGWRQTADATVRCEPWPESGAASCPVDEAHFPGTPGCALVGTACGVDEWATDLPSTGRVLYVRSGGATAGAGSRSDPFSSLSAALLTAVSGDVVALGKGTFIPSARIAAGVTLWGACVGKTTVQLNPATGLIAAIESVSSGVVVKNLRVTGPGVGVATGLSTAQVRLENVVVDHAVGGGVSAQRGAKITMSGVVIRDTQPSAQGTFGIALSADSGGQLTGQRVLISGATTYGLTVRDATTVLTLQDFAVLHVLGQPSDHARGYGIAASQSASLDLARGIVEDAQGNGLLCDTATCVLADTLVARTLPSASDGSVGIGVRVAAGSFHATRVVVRDNPGFGMLLGSKDVLLVDVVISGTTELAGGSCGVALLDAAVVSAARLSVEDGKIQSMSVSAASIFAATDLTVTGTRRGSIGDSALGLSVIEGSTVTLTRAGFEHFDGEAIIAGGLAVGLTATDLVISDQQVLDGGEAGGGIAALDAAKVKLTRARIDGVATTGLWAGSAGTSVVAEDLAITNMRLDGKQRLFGSAVVADDHASVRADRLRVSGSQMVGVQASGTSTVTLNDVLVTGTLLPDCRAPAPCHGERNVGLLAQTGASVAATAFLLLNNGGFGVLVDHAAVDLADGEVNGHEIGANVIDPGFDPTRLGVRVVYRNNVRKLDSAVVPIPMLPPAPAKPSPP